MNQKAIGSRIQRARIERGLTQEQLAERVGLTPTHISVIERGAKPPKLSTFVAIANELRCTADELLMDVLAVSGRIESSRLSQMLNTLTPQRQALILRVVDTMIKQMRPCGEE